MPANNMITQTKDIESAANHIKQINDDFTNAYKEIFNQFEKIDVAWNGDDNKEFNDHVMSFKKDFLEMTEFLNGVEVHLRLSAKAYLTTEKVGERRAGKLTKQK